MAGPDILLVEDDEAIAAGLVRVLDSQGHSVRRLARGRPAQAAAGEGVKLVILDLGLPDADGIDVCRRLRDARPDLAILIVSARDQELDVVAGLDAGADDYLSKPFDVDELLARVRVLQRRARGSARNVLEHGRLRLDPAALSVTHDGKPVALQRREFMLLQKLLAASGQVLTRAQLEESLYGWDEEIDSNTVEVTVYNLRKKLGKDFIQTLRGVGYMVRA